MVLYRVYSQPHLRKYYSTVCSRATLFQLIVYALMVIPPALIAYETNGKLLFQLKRTANWRWVLVYRRTRLQAPTLQTCMSFMPSSSGAELQVGVVLQMHASSLF